MISTSIVLAAAALIPASTVLGRGFGSADVAHHRRTAHNVARANSYHLEQHWEGSNFFDGWSFWSYPDPTNGYVNYLDKDKAMNGYNGKKALAYVQSDNTTIMAVDDTTWLGDGQYRDSVRISTDQKFNGGLFIADFYAMPHGCSVWPAWWSAGAEWPADGEIDVVEGVNLGSFNQYTLHTGSACQLKSKQQGNTAFTGNMLGTNCLSTQDSNAGCAVTDTRNTSFGHGFNMVGGGAFIHEWTKTGIKMWFFERSQIPADVHSQNPNPDAWPQPVANFDISGCDFGPAIRDQSLTFDITVCGGWAESAYTQDGKCPGSCKDAVKDPKNFKYAKWAIKSVSVYQQN